MVEAEKNKAVLLASQAAEEEYKAQLLKMAQSAREEVAEAKLKHWDRLACLAGFGNLEEVASCRAAIAPSSSARFSSHRFSLLPKTSFWLVALLCAMMVPPLG